MSKEDRREDVRMEYWFDRDGDEVFGSDVLNAIDADRKGLGKNAAKFTTGSISPSEREWNAMGDTDAERAKNFKAWVASEVTRRFAANFNKLDKDGNPIPILPENVKIFYKLEHNRYYKGTDEGVLAGEHKAGDAKAGFNAHIHFIVATKTEDGRFRINPKTPNRREFNRVDFFHTVEQSFDRRFDFQRRWEDSFAYCNFVGKFKLPSSLDFADKAFAQEYAGHDEEQERERRKQQRRGKQDEDKEL
jgi:hypothetical protein